MIYCFYSMLPTNINGYFFLQVKIQVIQTLSRRSCCIRPTGRKVRSIPLKQKVSLQKQSTIHGRCYWIWPTLFKYFINANSGYIYVENYHAPIQAPGFSRNIIFVILRIECNTSCFEMKKWSLQLTQFMQLRREAWKKIQDFNGVWTRDLAIPVRCSTNWTMKPLTLGADQLWVHIFPWKKWVLMIYEMNHMWTAEMKWNEEMIVAVNAIYAIA